MPEQLRRCLPITRSEWLWLFFVPATFLVLAIAALSIDIQVASYFKQGKHPHFVVELVNNSEPFGHGLGILAITIAVVLLDPSKRPRIVWFVGGSLGAGILASATKLLIARYRPRAFDLENGAVWQTFRCWFPGFGGTATQSMPSSHTVAAVGLAIMLTAWYPRGRWLFVTLAVLVGINRMHQLAHFPSDVLVGVALGWFVGSWCVIGDRVTMRNAPTTNAIDLASTNNVTK